MSESDYPYKFVEALDKVFGAERTDRALEKEQPVVEMLFSLWQQAARTERLQVFDYLRSEDLFNACEDQEWLTKVSWTIGNGSYLTTPNLSDPVEE